MNDDDRLHASAIERRDCARAREQFARRRQAEARQEAAEAPSRDVRRCYEHEANVHGRAAELHHHAVTLQSDHAEAHASDPHGADPRDAQG